MNVENQLAQIPVFLAQDGLVAVLKKVPAAALPFVEADGTAGQKPSPDRCNRDFSGTQQQMNMIAHPRPRIAGSLGFREQLG
jgi:hypothetical protein